MFCNEGLPSEHFKTPGETIAIAIGRAIVLRDLGVGNVSHSDKI